MKGSVAVDVAVADAKAALARAIASGALGRACEVRLDGDGFVFAGAVRGRVDVTDGRVVYDVTVPADGGAWTKAVLAAALVAAAATIGWSVMFPFALAIGAVAGVVAFVVSTARKTSRARRAIEALARSLPVLVDARRE